MLLLGKLLARNLQFWPVWPVWLFQLENQRATNKAWWADQAGKFCTWVHCAKAFSTSRKATIRLGWNFPWWSERDKKMVACWLGFPNAGINFIHNNLPQPRDMTWREQKPSPRYNYCVQKPSPRDRKGSQKPHSRDIKLEYFTNISINSDTIRSEKLCGLNK